MRLPSVLCASDHGHDKGMHYHANDVEGDFQKSCLGLYRLLVNSGN